jgi:hypothetical protein
VPLQELALLMVVVVVLLLLPLPLLQWRQIDASMPTAAMTASILSPSSLPQTQLLLPTHNPSFVRAHNFCS